MTTIDKTQSVALAAQAMENGDAPDAAEASEPAEPKRRRSKVDEQAENAATAKAASDELAEREREIEEARAELAKLEPTTEPVRWVIGKPPENGGKETQYSIYIQDKLPWMPRQQFFSLVSRTLAQALKASGESASLGDMFSGDLNSLREYGQRLSQRDFTDAAQFMTLLLELIGYSPDFMVDAYLILLDVPRGERGWARIRFSEPWRPEKDQWGLKDEDHEKIITTFIDQNYEEVRSFFVEKLPAIGRRVALHERATPRNEKAVA